MRSNITAQAKALINSPHCNKAFIALLEISHPLLATVRLANDQTDVVHNGNTYTAFPFEVKMLDETQNELTSTSVKLFWVDSSIKDLIQKVDDRPATMAIKWVLEGDWDTVQWEISPPLIVKKATIQSGQASFDLGLRSLRTEEFPYFNQDPYRFPGLWENR